MFRDFGLVQNAGNGGHEFRRERDSGCFIKIKFIVMFLIRIELQNQCVESYGFIELSDEFQTLQKRYFCIVNMKMEIPAFRIQFTQRFQETVFAGSGDHGFRTAEIDDFFRPFRIKLFYRVIQKGMSIGELIVDTGDIRRLAEKGDLIV